MRQTSHDVVALGLVLSAIVGMSRASELVLVTCGSSIKLQHDHTKGLLHSHDISYGSGSGQQSVTGSFEANDANSFWIVKAPNHGESCEQGTPLKKGSVVRLQHSSTRRWLHSHHFSSPITNNQEVSAFGGNEQSDRGDVWAVQWEKGPAQWQKDQKVSLKHVATGVFLASHDKKYGRPIAGQQEVCGKMKVDTWTATEGVYFPQRT